MTDNATPLDMTDDPGRFYFWLETHPGQRPPDHLIPDYLKSTYQEWDEFREPEAPLEVPQMALFREVVSR